MVMTGMVYGIAIARLIPCIYLDCIIVVYMYTMYIGDDIHLDGFNSSE